LGDPALQLKVMEKEPKSVEDALNSATKQEAFETSLMAYGHTACGHAAGNQDKVFPGKQVKVRALEEAGSDTDMSSLCQQVNQLQAELSKTTRSLEGLAADAGRVQLVFPGSNYAGLVQQVPPGSPQSKQDAGASNRSQDSAGSSGSQQGQASGGGHPSKTPSGRGRGVGRGRGQHRPAHGSDACRSCGGTGHWAKDCPNRPPGNQAVTGTVSSRAVNRVHVMAEI